MKAKRSNKNCVLFKVGGAFERVIKRSPRLIFADDVIKERSTNLSVELFALSSRN